MYYIHMQGWEPTSGLHRMAFNQDPWDDDFIGWPPSLRAILRRLPRAPKSPELLALESRFEWPCFSSNLWIARVWEHGSEMTTDLKHAQKENEKSLRVWCHVWYIYLYKTLPCIIYIKSNMFPCISQTMYLHAWYINIILVGGFNPSETYESQLGWLFPIYGTMKNVPNHHPNHNMIWMWYDISIKYNIIIYFQSPKFRCKLRAVQVPSWNSRAGRMGWWPWDATQ